MARQEKARRPVTDAFSDFLAGHTELAGLGGLSPQVSAPLRRGERETGQPRLLTDRVVWTPERPRGLVELQASVGDLLEEQMGIPVVLCTSEDAQPSYIGLALNTTNPRQKLLVLPDTSYLLSPKDPGSGDSLYPAGQDLLFVAEPHELDAIGMLRPDVMISALDDIGFSVRPVDNMPYEDREQLVKEVYTEIDNIRESKRAGQEPYF